MAAFGPLSCAPAGRGLRFGSNPTAYEDDAAAELSRALTAATVGDLRLNVGVGAADLAALADVLHLPKSVLARAGGAGRLLQERGVQTISLVDLGTPPAHAAADDIDALVDTLREAPDQLAARLQEASGGDAQGAARILQRLDRVVAAWRRAERDEAWTLMAGAIMGIAPSLRTRLCRIIASSLREPWAASIASRWPPVLFGGIVTSTADAAAQDADEVAASLRKLHRGPAPAPIPAVEEPVHPETARRSLEGAGHPARRTHASARFLNVLARLDTTRFEEGLRVVERGIMAAVASGDVETIGQILTGLAALTHRLADARADLARVMLHRTLTTAVRDLVSRSLSERAGESHPLRRAMAAAPEESVPLLLDLLADEERVAVRRQIVSLLAVLARTQIPLLAQYLGDSRWYVARNVVTALAEMRDSTLIPYLRAAVQHQDLRVRREALQALGGLNTPDALSALEAALHHPDAETRAAAAHWVRVAKTPGADA